jgi:hypothetical protein
MADLNDLKKFGESLLPIIQDLVQKAANDRQKPDTSAEDAAIAQLKKLVSESSQVTPASLEGRAAAIVAMRTALTEMLIQAATNQISLSETQVLTLQTQRNALRNAFGLLAEQSAFNPIATLLGQAEVTKISNDLDLARQGIQARKIAKDILDTVVTVAIVASQIAVKVATA